MERLSKVLNIVLGLIVVMLFTAGSRAEEIAPAQQAWGVHYEEPAVEVVGAEVLANGRNWYELNNGLGVLISEAEGIYELYLPFMEDHSLDYNNLETLKNGIKTYSNNFSNYVTETVNNTLEEYDRDQL